MCLGHANETIGPFPLTQLEKHGRPVFPFRQKLVGKKLWMKFQAIFIPLLHARPEFRFLRRLAHENGGVLFRDARRKRDADVRQKRFLPRSRGFRRRCAFRG